MRNRSRMFVGALAVTFTQQVHAQCLRRQRRRRRLPVSCSRILPVSNAAAGFDKNWYDFDIVTQAVLLYPDLVEAASDPSASLLAFFERPCVPGARRHRSHRQVGRLRRVVFDAVASSGCRR